MPLIINGETVPDELIEREFQGIKAHYERMGSVSCCDRDPEFRGYARDNVTARVLINQEAEKRFPGVERPEIEAGLARLESEHGGRAALISHLGLTEDQMPVLEEEIASGVRVDLLLQTEWSGWAGPSEEEMRAFLAAHQEDYLTAEEVRASHIFKQVEKVEERENIYQFLCALRRRVRAGEDFDTLARETTDKDDKEIDLGWFKRGEHMDEFDLIVFSLDEGEMTPVFASHWGFHLARVNERKPRVPRPFEEVAEAVRERMAADYRQEKTRELVEQLKSRAVIEDIRARS